MSFVLVGRVCFCCSFLVRDLVAKIFLLLVIFRPLIQALRACAASQHCEYAVWTFLNPPTQLILRMHQWDRTICFLLMENNDYLEFWVNVFAGNMLGSRKFCQRGSNFDNVFFLVDWRGIIQIPLLAGHLGPTSEMPFNGVSLVCRLWPKIESWLGSFKILRGSGPVLLKKPIILWFRGGGVWTPCPLFWIRTWETGPISLRHTIDYMQFGRWAGGVIMC